MGSLNGREQNPKTNANYSTKLKNLSGSGKIEIRIQAFELPIMQFYKQLTKFLTICMPHSVAKDSG